MPLYPWEFDDANNPKTVRVRKMKEKGSDVKLASNLLLDAFQQRADAFILLSNDSDYAEPLRIVSEQLGKTVGVIFPTDAPSKELLKINLTIVRQIREGVLASSQLPIELLDGIGVIRKPSTW
jgi:ABC-type branched-subunit amino acid transport system substrate-binding protein